jgi:sporulation protein YunB
VHILKYCCQKTKRCIKLSKNLKIGLSLIFSGVVMLLILADGYVRDIISDYPMNLSAEIIAKVMDDAMGEALSTASINPNNIDKVIYGENGKISSIETNTSELIKAKTEFTKIFLSKIKEFGDIISISIPIGTLIGNEYTIGRGPKITFNLQFNSTLTTEIKSFFIDAGVNNTLHTMELHATTNIYIIIPWGHNSKSVSTKYILAETAIVGDVPDAFTNINGADDEITDDIVDHGAEIK